MSLINECKAWFTDSDGVQWLNSRVFGNLTASGLSIEMKTRKITISDAAWTLLPSSSPLDDTNSIGVQNRSATVNIVISGETKTTADEAWIVKPGGEFFTDVKPAVEVYARVVSGGGSVDITLMEIA